MIAGLPIAVFPTATPVEILFEGSFCVQVSSAYMAGAEAWQVFLAGAATSQGFMAGSEEHGSC